MINLASLICTKDVACEVSEQLENRNSAIYDAMGRKIFVHLKLCHLASEKHCTGPKMVSEEFSKLQNISVGACPQTHQAVGCLRTHYEPDHLKPDGYGAACAVLNGRYQIYMYTLPFHFYVCILKGMVKGEGMGGYKLTQ